MPTSALTYCAAPNCRALVRRGRCDAHKLPAWGGKARLSRHARGYDAEYTRNRALVLARDPYCTIRTHCHGAPSTQADHILPRGGNDLSNLRGACATCNHRRGLAQRGGMFA